MRLTEMIRMDRIYSVTNLQDRSKTKTLVFTITNLVITNRNSEGFYKTLQCVNFLRFLDGWPLTSVILPTQKHSMNSFDLKTQSGRLRLIIAETGMTQSRFGEEVGISKQQVSNILSGERDVSDPVALVIEHRFGFRKDWLLMKNGPQKNKMNAFDIAALDAENTFHRKLDRTSGVRKMIKDFFLLSPKDQKMIIDMIGRLLKGKK